MGFSSRCKGQPSATRGQASKSTDRASRKKTGSEHESQAEVVRWATRMAASGMYPALRLLYAVPNGASTGPKQGAKLVAEGVKRGVPDLHLPVPIGGFAGLWIEMKHGKNTTTDDQDQWLADLESVGHKTAVCYTSDAAIAVIEHYLRGQS